MIEYYRQPRFQAFSLEHDADDSRDRVGAMLVHGFMGNPAEMRPLAEALFVAGLDCHAPAHPGMAGDITCIDAMTAAIWRRAMLDRWSEFTGRYERTVLIGYSMGAAAALQMAAQRAPNLVVLLAPFIRINDRRAFLLPLAKRVVKEFKILGSLDVDNPEVRTWFAAAMPGLDIDDAEVRRSLREDTGVASEVIDELRKFGAMGRQAAPKVAGPTVVIQGIQDDVVNPRHTRALLSRLPNLRSYHELPGDHLITVDSRPSWPMVRSIVLAETGSVMGTLPDA